MSNESTIKRWLDELESKYGDRRKTEFERERSTVATYLEALSTTLGATYQLDKPLAVGGTGVVFVGHHKRFTQPIAVKFNRPITTLEKSMVENESQILPTLSHPNIIRVLDVGEKDLTPKLTYVVEPFIEGAKPLFTIDKDKIEGTWLKQNINSLRDQLPADGDKARAEDYGKTAQLVNDLLGKLTRIFAQWVSLLAHLHSPHPLAPSGYVYLDVKPENVLVDDHEHLISIDYGSVERIDLNDHSPLNIFYTERYAHPKPIERKQGKTSSNRVRGGMKRSELRAAFDYYALGISLLEMLNEIASIRPHAVPQLALYRSLHFLATRLLDGQNSSRAMDNHYLLALQVFPSLRDADYSSMCYTNLSDVSRDLAKERGRWNVEDQVPELATYSKDIVRVVPAFNTVLTPRLRNVIEHPLVARLKYVTQLGLVSLVYPTADHSRYDHALGSYTYTTNYVKSLFNDLGNPIFRNLVGVEDFNAVLLASLLHDLGQYPLAHDLEEVHDRIFKHGRIGIEFFKDPTPDRHGRTLLEIIEDPKNGWAVSQATLLQIYGAHSRNVDIDIGLDLEAGYARSLKTDVLTAVIDGPVDADKADYIVRDSHRCELPYGNQLDLERLLRVLTVAIMPGDAAGVRRVTLGVYDKGVASAHAFGQARYQLLATVSFPRNFVFQEVGYNLN